MRTLHLYSGNLYGGIETMLVTMANASGASASTHEFALCFDGRLARELRGVGATVHLLGEVRMSRPMSLRRARRAAGRLLRDGGYDRAITHAPWAHAVFAGVAREAGVPVVFWAHDLAIGTHWTERLASRVVPDRVICNSRFTSTSVTRLYQPLPPCTVIHPPVARTTGGCDAAERTTLRETLSTAAGDVVIATACRSESWKGHEAIVRALAALREVAGWTWWQIGGTQRPGERSYLDGIKQLAARHGIDSRVRWLGERSDVPALLRGADIYCQPNTAPEPFGIAFVEALSAGLPVVTSDFGGAREIVDATCGVLVPPADDAALAAALERLITDGGLRGRLAAGGPARAREVSDPAARMRELDAVLAAAGESHSEWLAVTP